MIEINDTTISSDDEFAASIPTEKSYHGMETKNKSIPTLQPDERGDKVSKTIEN